MFYMPNVIFENYYPFLHFKNILKTRNFLGNFQKKKTSKFKKLLELDHSLHF